MKKKAYTRVTIAVLFSAVFITVSLFYSSPAPAADADGDGLEDAFDNCTEVPNPDQRDSDGDGYGTVCDPDFNQNGVVDSTDLSTLKLALRSTAPDMDLNGNGVVDSTDYSIGKSYLRKPPGPSCCGNFWQKTLTGDGINTYSISTPPTFAVKQYEAGTLGLYASEQTYTSGIPATVGINIRSIPAGSTLLAVAENAVSASIGEFVWTLNISGKEFIVHNEVLDENMEIVVFTTIFTGTEYIEIVAPTQYAESVDFITMLSSLETNQ